MTETDVPILNKSYELYKIFHEYRKVVPKQDRFNIYERGEHAILEILELLLEASYADKPEKLLILKRTSVRLNILRFLIRLMKETRTFDTKKYIVLQEIIDEIGRMLGGWIRASDR